MVKLIIVKLTCSDMLRYVYGKISLEDYCQSVCSLHNAQSCELVTVCGKCGLIFSDVVLHRRFWSCDGLCSFDGWISRLNNIWLKYLSR